MTRRSLTLAVVTFATSALAACAEPSTAPQPSQFAPASTSQAQASVASCRSGWTSSSGRC